MKVPEIHHRSSLKNYLFTLQKQFCCVVLGEFLLIFSPFFLLAATAEEPPISPQPGVPLRREILDGLRQHLKKISGIDVIFIVNDLRVEGDWAWVTTKSQSIEGQEHHEDMTALLRKEKGRWVPVCFPYSAVADENFNRFSARETCQKHYPQAPAKLFPFFNWRLFSDTASGISFHYPADWKISRQSGVVSAGPAAQQQRKDKTPHVLLSPPCQNGESSSNNWIVINPIRSLTVMQNMGKCFCKQGNYLCTYSNNQEIQETMKSILESFSPGFINHSPCK